MRKFLFGLAAMLGLLSVCGAQMAAPPEQMKQLEPLFGSWAGDFETTMGPMKIDLVIEWGPGRMSQHTRSTMRVESFGEIVEDLYTVWDEKAGAFRSYAFQSMVPTPRIELGKWEGQKFISISEPWEMMGMSYVSRATMEVRGEDEIHFMLEFQVGDEWSKQGEGVLKRKA